jgi:alanyl-tRNA synthetase
MEGFETAMAAQRDRGRAAARFSASLGQRVRTVGKVEFLGYEAVEERGTVTGVFDAEGQAVARLEPGDGGIVVLDRTPFYAESGGQVGDAGTLLSSGASFRVDDTQSSGDQHLHVGVVTLGRLQVGDTVNAVVDPERRRRIRLNHSATHLMHAALRNILGGHVQQKGSLVAPDRLRFDFSHPEPVTGEQLLAVEREVNAQIQANSEVGVELLGYDEAIARGAMALFGEKYGDRVRVLTMGAGYSVELCGGTHVARTGDIGLFQVLSETGVAAGVRRIEAVSGPAALARVEEGKSLLAELAVLVKAGRADLRDKVGALVEENRRTARELEQLQNRLAASQGSDLAGQATEVAGIKVLAATVEGDSKSLLQTLDSLKSKLGACVVVLGNVSDGKVNLIAGVSKDLTDRIKAPELISLVGPQVGARGGGRPDMARAGGGDNPDGLREALAGVAAWTAQRLS